MSDIWAPVVAGLGGVLLGGLITFFVEVWRTRKADKSSMGDRRTRAYGALLARSAAILHLASNLHFIMQSKSGLREGLNIVLGRQQALDAVEVAKLTNTETQPLFDAWSDIWMVGSEEAIAQANDLVAHCGEVISAATQRGDAQPLWLTGITGEKWTKTQLDEWGKAQRELAEARKKFGEIARKETGLETVDLFASNKLNRPAKQLPSRRFWRRH